MSNMGYCRFENTVGDMEDCIENIDDTSDMSESEEQARAEFIAKCVQVALDYGDEIGQEVETIQ